MFSSPNEIFKSLASSQNCRCRLKRYHASHSSGIIEVTEEGSDNLYLVFEGVEYIECPVSWRGANIFSGSAEECLEILRKLKKGFEELPGNYLAEKYHLYKFQHPDFRIRILANSIYLTKDSSVLSA